ncbi:MAG: hypothetical protein WC421_01805 [Elusimicrobiales bacterium]
MKLAAAFLAIFCCCSAAQEPEPSAPAQFSLDGDIDAAWLAGIRHMYSLDFAKARAEFERLAASRPEHPAGDLALAGLLWWQYSQDYDIPKHQVKATAAEFEKYAGSAIEKSEKYLKTHPKDAGTYFIMGTAYGLLGRWCAVERRWWRAYRNGTKGRKYLKKALDRNPEIYDAYAGLGIFDYYSDTVPGVLKLPELLLIHGSKKRGLAELEQAVTKGRFFVTESKLFKIAIEVAFEHDCKTALSLAQELRASEPGNVFFRFTEFATRFNCNDWEGAMRQGRELLADKAAASALDRQLALIYLAIGDAYMMSGSYTLAINAFTEGIATRYPEKGWVTYCYIRRGQSYELMGARERALEDYKTAASREDFWSTMDDAERGLSKPYSKAEIEAQLQAH